MQFKESNIFFDSSAIDHGELRYSWLFCSSLERDFGNLTQ